MIFFLNNRHSHSHLHWTGFEPTSSQYPLGYRAEHRIETVNFKAIRIQSTVNINPNPNGLYGSHRVKFIISTYNMKNYIKSKKSLK